MWNRGFILNLIANFTFWMCFFVHVPLMPFYLEKIGTAPTMAAHILSVFPLGALLGRLMSGKLIDRWGARPFLVTGGGVMAILSPLAVTVTDDTGLLLIRIGLGWALGVFSNATMGYSNYIVPENKRGTAASILGLTNNTAAMLVPPLVTGILFSFGFTTIFIGAGIIIGVGAITGFFLPAANVAKNTASQKNKKLITKTSLFPGFVSGSVGAAAGAFITYSALIALDFQFKNTGLFLSIFAVSNIPSLLLAGPISDRYGRFWAIFPGFVFIIGALIIMGYFPIPAIGFLAPVLLGLGMGSFGLGVIAWAVDRSPVDERANASSSVLVIWELFVWGGATFQGYMFANGTQAIGFQYIGGLILIMALIYSFSHLKNRKLQRAQVTA